MAADGESLGVGQLGIGLGYPGMPHVITRYMAARDDREVQRLQVIAIFWGIAVFYGAGLVGLVGRVTLPELADGGAGRGSVTALTAESVRCTRRAALGRVENARDPVS